MQLETLLSAKVDEKLEFFPEFKVSLTEEGIQIYAKSPIFAEMIAKQPGLKPGDDYMMKPWRGNSLRLYSKLPKLSRYLSFEYGVWLRNRDEDGPRSNPNLFWLTHPDLAKGCTITIREPIALNDVEDYFTTACASLREIYMHHIRTAEFRAKLSEIFEK